jgi:hypothetical protein
VTPVEEKLVQHHLRWFGYIQQRPAEAPIRNGGNNTWEESVKRNLKDWCITKELALDRRE